MNSFTAARAGYSLVEVVVVLVLLGILAVLATPSLRRQVQLLYVRGALDQVAAEVYRTRMLAVESGGPARLILHPDEDGCVRRISVGVEGEDTLRRASFRPTLPMLCMRHSGDTILTFNSRGILRPPARSFHVTYGSAADSVLLSIAGRVRRSYRRRGYRNLCRQRQFFRLPGPAFRS
jgi:prepilin-type N-terminal cleavage/methylation domain-containing protein